MSFQDLNPTPSQLGISPTLAQLPAGTEIVVASSLLPVADSATYPLLWTNPTANVFVPTGFVVRIYNPNGVSLNPSFDANEGSAPTQGTGNLINGGGAGNITQGTGEVVPTNTCVFVALDNLVGYLAALANFANPMIPAGGTVYAGFTESGTKNGQSYGIDMLGYFL